MTPVQRWCLVALGVALVIGVPLTLGAIPAADSEVSASRLLSRVQAASGAPYSGYAESVGTLQLPVADDFTDVGNLLSQRTRMRVWWRGSEDWRVATLGPTGETDLFHDAFGTTEWDYESQQATLYEDPEIRLPRSLDLLPPELASRLLEDADPDDLQRLPAESVAGRDAPGLRLTPSAPQSSIGRVELWVDPASGIPLRVSVYARGADHSAVTSEFLQFSDARPSRSDVSADLAPGVAVDFDDVIDIADAADQFAPLAPPNRIGGLKRSSSARLGAVGVYGSGVTATIAIPLWGDVAEPLREQLDLTIGVRHVKEGHLVSLDPLGILLTEFSGTSGGWLITGTVTERTLIRAAHDIQRARLVER